MHSTQAQPVGPNVSPRPSPETFVKTPLLRDLQRFHWLSDRNHDKILGHPLAVRLRQRVGHTAAVFGSFRHDWHCLAKRNVLRHYTEVPDGRVGEHPMAGESLRVHMRGRRHVGVVLWLRHVGFLYIGVESTGSHLLDASSASGNVHPGGGLVRDLSLPAIQRNRSVNALCR